jgi:hypothetical protein
VTQSFSSDGQQGLPIAVPVQPNGDTRVDAALERLQELDQVPIEDHAEIFGDIHSRLSAALGEAAPGRAPGSEADS